MRRLALLKRQGSPWRVTSRGPLWRSYVVIATSALALSVTGCETDGASPWASDFFGPRDTPTVTKTVQDPTDVQYYPSDEPLRLGMEHFNRGHYGIAERYFRDAVEKAPRDATAWVGLAASYDRIGRFDLADRAYAQAVKLVGETTDILNNLGYSYMLRGNYPEARKKFLQALGREPRNPTIINNLWLLDSSSKAVGRSPDQ
jgi:tetratricopeptide (TPR) repeat protein